MDDIWKVMSIGYTDYYSPNQEFIYYDTPEKLYQGSLSDCEVFLNLKKGRLLISKTIQRLYRKTKRTKTIK